MSHARTIPRYVGLAGITASILVAVPSLASTTTIRDVNSLRSTPTHIESTVRASYRHSANDPRYFKSLRVMVSRSSLRTAALAAASVVGAVPHPGLRTAALAAGLLLGASGEVLAPTGGEETINPNEEPDFPTGVGQWSGFGVFTDTLSEAVSSYENQFNWTLTYEDFRVVSNPYEIIYIATFGCTYISSVSGRPVQCRDVNIGYEIKHGEEIPENYQNYSPTKKSRSAPASPDQVEELDEHLPSSIVDDIWKDSSGTYPGNWNDPDIQTDGNAAPEIQEAVSQWAENLAAKLEGQSAPHPDAATGGNTAPEQQLERQKAWEEAPPESAYPAMPSPEWNVNVIEDLPDYNVSLGSAQCPDPDVITIPGYGDITLDWQPACDLASGIRGAVIGICFIAALYIALGQSRSSES